MLTQKINNSPPKLPNYNKGIPYFLEYKMHQTIRRTKVLKEENGRKNHDPLGFPTPPPASQVSYIQTIRRTPIFLPNLGGGRSESYNPKNTVY